MHGIVETKEQQENYKESLKQQARNCYKSLSKKEKEKKRKWRANRCKNMTEKYKQKLKESEKNIETQKKKKWHCKKLIFLSCIV